jgi:hypothetical protein
MHQLFPGFLCLREKASFPSFRSLNASKRWIKVTIYSTVVSQNCTVLSYTVYAHTFKIKIVTFYILVAVVGHLVLKITKKSYALQKYKQMCSFCNCNKIINTFVCKLYRIYSACGYLYEEIIWSFALVDCFCAVLLKANISAIALEKEKGSNMFIRAVMYENIMKN